jgi:hypothetical protein
VGSQASAGSAGGGPPLVGGNLFQFQMTGPYCGGRRILLNYHQTGVRPAFRDDLAAMRSVGVQTFRFFLANEHGGDPVNPPDWARTVDSSGGHLSEPYRTNLINLLTDIREAGFRQVTLAFWPRGANDPTEVFSAGARYDPALFEENWGFIQDVRPLLKQYGPASTHVDLYNEGAPGVDRPGQVKDYLARMYARYVDAFGADDVTISSGAIAATTFGNTEDDSLRMQNLIDALRGSGKPLPGWFDVHPSWDGRVLEDLRAIDKTLAANGLSQPLVIGEVKYNDPVVAAGIVEFIRTSSRPIVEVMEWPNIVQGSVDTQPSCPNPPYRIDAYATALQGSSGPPTLTATVGPKGPISLVTAYGNKVTALEAGSYQLAIRDSSRTENFHLIGPGVNVHTGLSQRGTRQTTITLRGETQYLYRSDRHGSKLAGSFYAKTPG